MMEIKEEFEKYFNEWMKEINENQPLLNSHLDNYCKSKYFEKIINLGKAALPFIIEKLKQNYFILNRIVSEIVKISIVDLEQFQNKTYSEQEISSLWVKWWEDNLKIPKIATSIAPWALPKEEIPLYVNINKTIPYSKIMVEIPDCCNVKELINVLNANQKDGLLEIKQIGKIPFTKTDYFGIILTSNKIFKELAVETPIKITLIEENGAEESITAKARIFRPLLEINKIPPEISINDNYETILPIHLTYTGFGDISLRIEGEAGGDIVTEGGRSVLDTVIYGLMREGLPVYDEPKKSKKGIIVNKQKLLGLLDEFKDKLRDVNYLSELEKDKEITREAIDWLKSFNETEKEKFMNVMYDTMETYIIKKITDSISKNVTNKTHLDSGTKISTEIKTKITNIKLKIFYKDLAGNIYPPLETTVNIVDKREHATKLRVTIPIEIENVDESGAYKNVEEMPIGIIV